jgi:cellulose biosynthesis protein BcsQ
MEDAMAEQIALFNHKGGVSKTTTTFNLGCMLASKGKKVIIVDCDPQCNLTGMVLGFKGSEEFNTIYEAGGVRNIRDGLAPAFESKPSAIEPVTCEPIEGQPDLYLLPGHIGLAEYEVTLGIAQELSGSLVTLQNLPGSLRFLFDLTADKYMADLVLIDMSPSLGAINQNLLMTSDYFLVPMAPDYFSVMAIDSLASILPKWASWAKQAKTTPILQKATYPFPDKKPKFLGTIIQKFRLRERKIPSKAFQSWIDEIEKGIRTKLIPVLRANNMFLHDSIYIDAGIQIGQPIMQMSDFNSLIALSQKHKAPIFGLTDNQLGQTGIVLERNKKSMKRFYDMYSEGADKIIAMINNAKRYSTIS